MVIPSTRWIRAQLDPDVTILGWDKAAHLAGFFFAAALLHLALRGVAALAGVELALGLSLAAAFLGAALGAFLLELGQWDIARHVPGFHEVLDRDGEPQPGTIDAPFLPGFGFGLLDLAAGTLGALLFVVARALQAIA